MGLIRDYQKATDDELAQEISWCNASIHIMNNLNSINNGLGEALIEQNRHTLTNRLKLAEQELERRYLLS